MQDSAGDTLAITPPFSLAVDSDAAGFNFDLGGSETEEAAASA